MQTAHADRFFQTDLLCSVETRKESEEKIYGVTSSAAIVNVETVSTTEC